MVPVIDFSKDLSSVLNYNEEKVQRGVAELIHAENFLKSEQQLNFHDKLARFEKLNELNEICEANTLHVSLNFHPEDTLTKEQLCEIAGIYMERIGYGGQPYLIYQHFDSGHPHVHIVSSLIQPNGKRIPTNNIGKNQSVKARKEIDQKFNLRKVEDSQHTKIYEPEPLNAQKVNYGKAPTKKAIKDVLRYVIKNYKFTSLPEYNAVLQQWNVLADRGTQNSRIYKNGGLVYRALENGKKIGVPIKASDFYFKPTLKGLQEKFENNKPIKKAAIPEVKGRIDWTLSRNPKTLITWQEELLKENIRLVVRRNEQGVVYGLTYVDGKSKCVLNGSDIGKQYSAQAIVQFFSAPGKISSQPPIEQPKDLSQKTVNSGTLDSSRRKPNVETGSSSIPAEPRYTPRGATRIGKVTPPINTPAKSTLKRKAKSKVPEVKPVVNNPRQGSTPSISNDPSLLKDLLTELPADQIPYELKIEKKKKKKRKLNL